MRQYYILVYNWYEFSIKGEFYSSHTFPLVYPFLCRLFTVHSTLWCNHSRYQQGDYGICRNKIILTNKGKVEKCLSRMDSETTWPISAIFTKNVRLVHEKVYHKFHQNPYEHLWEIAIFVFRSSSEHKSRVAKSKQQTIFGPKSQFRASL